MPKILVFSKTMGYNHSSIPSGIAAIQALGTENNFQVDTTKSSTMFREEILKDYAAVVFLNTTGNVLNHEQEAAFERYIQSGGGFVGIHAATDTEYDWNWYGRLVGAYFESHPPGVAEADFHIRDHDFIATSNFDDDLWVHTDELYNFRKIYEPVNVLIEVDENTYEGGTNGAFHPMAWYHEYDGGRSFYTALGHTDESFSEQKFLKHILGGIQYAIGENYELEYKKAIIQIPPEQDRFSKHSLTIGQFYEPTEMTILPNNDVLISQRRGEVMHFDSESGTLKELVKLDVYH
ncbi:MAG: ThuA domain-containing protein, partial [Flavobacteriaceae bacterium]